MAKKKKAGAAVVPKSAHRKVLRKANESARDQFAALGLFIQNFENIVATLKGECARILRGGQLGISNVDPKILVFHWNICSLAFHHEVMTAKPIVEIWRALTFEQCQAMMSLSTLSEKGRSVTDKIVKEIATEFMELIGIRNHLLHATWSIGRWASWQKDFSAINVEKFRVSKEGLQRRDGLPQSFSGLIQMGKRAEKLWGKLGRFLQFFIYNPDLIEHVFSNIDGEWVFDRQKFEAIAKRGPSPKKPPGSAGVKRLRCQ